MRKRLGMLVAGLAVASGTGMPVHAQRACTGLTSADEIALCQNDKLADLDKALNEVYVRVAKQQDPVQRRTLKLLQKEWLTRRSNCLMADSTENRAIKDTCLARNIESRIAFLKGLDRVENSIPDRIQLVSYERQSKAVKDGNQIQRGSEEIGFYAYIFEPADTPGKQAFNAEIAKQLSEAKNTDRGDFEWHDFHRSTYLREPYRHANFISATIVEELVLYRSENREFGIAFDLRSGMPLYPKNIFSEHALNDIKRECRRQFDSSGSPEIKDGSSQNASVQNATVETSSFQAWEFHPEGIKIRMSGDPAWEDEKSCVLPTAFLKERSQGSTSFMP